MSRFMIIAGGTGGHIFPALAVADRLQQAGHEVCWLGARYGMESQLVPQRFPIDYISMQGVRKRGLAAKLLAPLRTLQAVWHAYRVIRRRQPQVVLAMGGYVAAPGGLAAWLAGCPLVIHEQNARAGLTNRVLARLAKTRLQAFDGAFKHARPATTVGNPVREQLWSLPAPAERFAEHVGPLRVLVLGGSQGARAINQCVVAAWQALADPSSVTVWHQTGEKDYAAMQAAYRDLPISARVEPFISEVAQAYAWADLVICRAGAMTVSELAAVGVASLLIPYPAAVDNHQYYNAKFLSDPRAGVLIEQKDLSTAAILSLLESFVANRRDLLIMAQSARRLAQRDATDRVASACLNLVH